MTFTGSAGYPRWSPDGRWISFDSIVDGHADIYVINAEGGPPRRLTTTPSNDFLATWSRDGRWIYFGSDRSGSSQVWKSPAEGGEALQMTKRGGAGLAFESRDGKVLYYYKGESVWRMPIAGGEETLILDHVLGGYSPSWMKTSVFLTGGRLLASRSSFLTLPRVSDASHDG